MGFWKRVLGICDTRRPQDGGCWEFANGTVTIDLTRAPELESGGSALRLEGRRLPQRLLVVRHSDGDFRAYQNRCTHMGRRIDPLGKHNQLRCCSVNKSTFSEVGEVLAGPGKGSLKTFAVTREGDRLMVALQ
jgi:nitrite reductase/ring-hydroxylating ferredoxin subunit